MEQTPIEQLIEYCKRSAEFVSGPDDSKEDRFAGMAYKDVVDIATELLATEKERDKQIASDAYEAGENYGIELVYCNQSGVMVNYKKFPTKEQYILSLTK